MLDVSKFHYFSTGVVLMFAIFFLSCRMDDLDTDNTRIIKRIVQNDNKPELELTAIQTQYSGTGNYPICEYIKITALTSGNLRTLLVYSVYDTERKGYSFPNINVSRGEKIVVHLRSGIASDGSIDELGSNLNESTSPASFADARDFWDANNASGARLCNDADVVALKWTDNDAIADALPYFKQSKNESEREAQTWRSTKYSAILQTAKNCGVWSGGTSPKDAVDITGTSVTKPLCKTKQPHVKDSWSVIAESSSVAPATQNDNKPELEFTELQTKYTSGGGNPIYEYLKIKALTNGNLATLQVYSLRYGKSTAYNFPSVDVKQGEEFVVHLRSGASGCVDEVGGNLDEATAGCAFKGVRDFWDTDNTSSARLYDAGDIVILQWADTGEPADILPYAKNSITNWPSALYTNTITDAIDYGFWDGNTSPSSAACVDGCASTKPLVKKSATHEKQSWSIGKATQSVEPVPDDETEDIPDDDGDFFDDDDDDGADLPVFSPPEISQTPTTNAPITKSNGRITMAHQYVKITKVNPFCDEVSGIHEYVELTILKDCNLQGAKLFSLSCGESKAYTFPSINLKSDEKVLVHFHKGANSDDELGSDLSKSKDTTARNDARDLWDKNNFCDNPDDDHFCKKGDIIVLRDKDRNLMSFVPYTTDGGDFQNAVCKEAMQTITRDFWAGKPANISGADATHPLTKWTSGFDAAAWCVSPDTNASFTDSNVYDFPCKKKDINFNFNLKSPGYSNGKYSLSARQNIDAIITKVCPYSHTVSGEFYGEFIELYFVKGGNLADLHITFMNETGSDKSADLPQVHINDSEFVVIHIANYGDGCVSETGSNLNLSTAHYSAAGARDIWLDKRVASNTANPDKDVLDNKFGAVVLQDKSGAVMDFMCYLGDGTKSGYGGGRDLARKFTSIVNFAIEAGLWTWGHDYDDERANKNVNVAKYISDNANRHTFLQRRIVDAVFKTGHEGFYQDCL